MIRLRPSLVLIASSLLAILFLGGYSWHQASGPAVDELIEQARQARLRRAYLQARNYAENALTKDPQSPAALRILGQIAADEERIDEAIACFERAARKEGIDAIASALHAGRLHLRSGQAAQAEIYWKRALELNPGQTEASSELAYLLGIEGRGWEMQGLLLNVIRGGQPTIHHLVLMAASEPVIKDQALVERCLLRVPDNLNVRVGEARNDLFEGRSSQALTLLRRICERSQASVEARARLGWALLELAPDEFLDWQSRIEMLPDHPELWAVQGAWALRHKDLSAAARCFAKAIQIDSDHRMANYQLGAILSQLGRSAEAQPFLERANKLQQLALLADRIYAHPYETFQMRQALELTAALGRPYEAWAWCQAALKINPNLDWARLNEEKLARWLRSTAPRVIPEALPALPPDLLQTPIPASERPLRAISAAPHSESLFGTPRFDDVAADIGLDFVYDAGSRNRADGVDSIEFTGGGVAAFDYDRDDRVDLYFTQGRAIPFSIIGPQSPDKLFRQSLTGMVIDVTEASGLGDLDYSQGCASGDFDQDGFADLYVCNVGRNRLYHNNGDGTFRDITDEAGLDGREWTVSALFADLNGDGFPELFDVNYLKIDEKAIPFCSRGREDTHCAPSSQPPAPDRLWLNSGDGRFRDISSESGLFLERDVGRGLGIVAADLNGDGQLDLFIANDAEPNFLYLGRRQRESHGIPRFEESAVVAGVAYDRDGLSQACMGVAVGDADRNGQLDLFVTNYADQSNTLYQQLDHGVFQDTTREAGLREPSFALLGFGTQFLDADLDGWLDLMVTNGHVYDMSYAGKAYAMRPQFFRNAGLARFVELFQENVGEFFGRQAVGRGLARLDWNRDGLPDVVISHIGSPAALLLNRTQEPGHFLGISLTGTASERDAYGTKARVLVEGQFHSLHYLISGDGYESHNDTSLLIGVGSATKAVDLEITWPSGQQQLFRNVIVDEHYRIIEGNERMYRRLTARSESRKW